MLEHEAQTDLSGVGVDLVVAQRAPPPVTPTKTKTAKERKEEAAKELGVDIELVKQYLETQKPSNQRIVELSAPASPRRVAGAGRWRSRMLPGSMVQAPSLLISVSPCQASRSCDMLTEIDVLAGQYFPTAARPYVGQVLDSGVTLMLYSATIFLFGILVRLLFLPRSRRASPAKADRMYALHSPRGRPELTCSRSITTTTSPRSPACWPSQTRALTVRWLRGRDSSPERPEMEDWHAKASLNSFTSQSWPHLSLSVTPESS